MQESKVGLGLDGFAQDPLPIAPTEAQSLGAQAISNYKNNFSFQSEVLNGDVAAAYFKGGTYAYDSIALWLNSSYGATETELVNQTATKWYAQLPSNSMFSSAGLIVPAVLAHSLDTLNKQASRQVNHRLGAPMAKPPRGSLFPPAAEMTPLEDVAKTPV